MIARHCLRTFQVRIFFRYGSFSCRSPGNSRPFSGSADLHAERSTRRSPDRMSVPRALPVDDPVRKHRRAAEWERNDFLYLCGRYQPGPRRRSGPRPRHAPAEPKHNCWRTQDCKTLPERLAAEFRLHGRERCNGRSIHSRGEDARDAARRRPPVLQQA
jgi:hypothetical protein